MSQKELTEKQKAFCEEYLIDLNGTKAAIRAGYSEKTARSIATENLTKPDIANYIKELIEGKRNERIASQDEVLEFLTKGMRGEIKDQFDLEATFQDRIKCSELLGKRYGTFVEKKDINGKFDTEIKVTLTDD